jgi:Kef-type K+ transport system membrane component KefB
MVLGATVANLATHHETAFSEIEGIEGPFLILFFILAGASLDLASLSQVGVLLALFVAGRFVGKLAGSWLGATLVGAPQETRQWMGYTLTPQAGVAVGMALIAIDRFPEYHEVLLPTVVASTVFFELVGPLLTKFALRRARIQAV